MFFNPKYSTTIFIVRHGQSLGNAKRLFLGHTDLDLSELGYRQARKTADLLKNIEFNNVYSSSLIRAVNTAVPNAEMRGMSVIRCDELREMGAGEWENMNIDDIISKYGDKYVVEWRKYFGSYTIPGGEPALDVANRLYDKLMEIARENVGKNVFVASHAAAIRSLWGKINNILPGAIATDFEFPNNASVSTIYYDGERLIPGVYSYYEHLEDCK